MCDDTERRLAQADEQEKHADVRRRARVHDREAKFGKLHAQLLVELAASHTQLSDVRLPVRR